jgi:Leucine-rich repeat (LRR) protein
MQDLDLSNNLFDEIPVITGNLELLKELKEWDVGIGLFKVLSKLDISHNNISKWPAQLENLVKMTKLDVSFNKLAEIPAECMAVFRELSYFNFANNHIKSFPPCLYDLPLHVRCRSRYCCYHLGFAVACRFLIPCVMYCVLLVLCSYDVCV